MQAVIKVWPLPDLSEKQLRELFNSIVKAAEKTSQLKIRNEGDLMVGFPKDMMTYGAGSELVVEVSTGEVPGEGDSISYELVGNAVLAIKEFFKDQGCYTDIKVYGLKASTIYWVRDQ